MNRKRLILRTGGLLSIILVLLVGPSSTISSALSLDRATSKIYLSQPPSASSSYINSIVSPASAPIDLVQMAKKVTESVVTVVCGKDSTTGFSAHVAVSQAMKDANFLSYIVTDRDNIFNCLATKKVMITLPNLREYPGTILIDDASNDLAGLIVNIAIPSLEWQGITPQEGWWAGVIGSPLGYPGVLTTGIISSVSSENAIATTTAHINVGNSGGPVFDRMGRVLGIASEHRLGTEGFGQVVGSPKLCELVIKCLPKTVVWGKGTIQKSPTDVNSGSPNPTASTPAISPQPNTNSLAQASADLLASTKKVVAKASSDVRMALIKYPKAKAALTIILKGEPKAPTFVGDLNMDIDSVTKYVSDAKKYLIKVSAAIKAASTSGNGKIRA